MSIIKSHNKKSLNADTQRISQCNCRKKDDCPLNGKCRAKNIISKCVTSTTGHPKKVSSGTVKADFKKCFYNHKQSFNNQFHAKDTSLSKYIWEMNSSSHIISAMAWHIVKSVLSYSNITKKGQLCLKKIPNCKTSESSGIAEQKIRADFKMLT